MTYVITQPCIGVKDASCVDVCPVDCIHPTTGEDGFEEAEMLYINPDECIDCGACEPACPVTAIFEESAVPEEWKQFTKINADFFNSQLVARWCLLYETSYSSKFCPDYFRRTSLYAVI